MNCIASSINCELLNQLTDHVWALTAISNVVQAANWITACNTFQFREKAGEREIYRVWITCLSWKLWLETLSIQLLSVCHEVLRAPNELLTSCQLQCSCKLAAKTLRDWCTRCYSMLPQNTVGYILLILITVLPSVFSIKWVKHSAWKFCLNDVYK